MTKEMFCHSDEWRNLKEIKIKNTSNGMLKTLGTHNYYVYILTNKAKTVLYTGMTNNLKERLHWHRYPGIISKHFTTRYRCYYLIYFEHYQDVDLAIDREKQLKSWRREKKENLIKGFNSEWRFLNDEI